MNSAGVGYTNLNVESKTVGVRWLRQDILQYMHNKYDNRVGLENISYEEWLSGQTIRESEIRALPTYPLLTSPELEIINNVLNQMRTEVGNEMGRALVKHNDSITPHIRPIVGDTSNNVLPFASNNKPVSAEGFRQAA